MKIYTKTGDSGDTSLFDGTRVPKSDSRVEAYGEVDELNACLGVARASGLDPDIEAALVAIQRDLFALGAELADPRPALAEFRSRLKFPTYRGWVRLMLRNRVGYVDELFMPALPARARSRRSADGRTMAGGRVRRSGDA